MGALSILAEAFRYPSRDRLSNISEAINALPREAARSALNVFVERAGRLSLVQWQELYTRTFDINPCAPPYVAFVIWGQSYNRGRFMAKLGSAMRALGIDLDGELPDHLVPLLRYLDRASDPITELNPIMELALRSIHNRLKKADPNSIYLGLLEAVVEELPWHDEAVSLTL
jgi:nitrate reductase delta subunit